MWRDHPLEGSDCVFERLVLKFPGRISRNGNMTLINALKNAIGVVTVNSNGGLEALSSGLPVRLLGQCYYAALDGVCVDDESFLRRCHSLNKHQRDDAISRDAHRFLRECFIPVNYRDNNFENAYLVASMLLTYLE